MFIRLLTVTLLALSTLSSWSVDKVLRFNEGRFRILQLTDLHLDPSNVAGCDSTELTIRNLVNQNRPNLIVVTGDLVTDNPAIDGWQRVVKLFNDLAVPFTVTMGNHDAEYLKKQDIYTMLMSSPFYYGDMGPDGLTGCGNVVFPIIGENNTPAALVYCIDSNDYPTPARPGAYDWIHFDQIQWYRTVSHDYTTANGGQPLPAIAFFHIPLIEYSAIVNDPSTIGSKLEGSGAPGVLNSGMLASLVEMGDVMGTFVGHDHENDYVGMHEGIALGYGRATGTDAYGELPRGGRIIDLREGKRRFDTQIVTPGASHPVYYYPSGLNSLEADTMQYHKAVKTKAKSHGVAYQYHEGLIKKCDQIDTTVIVKTGNLSDIDISVARREDHFGIVFDALLQVPERGVYKFYALSDDGSQVFIDNTLVVDNDGGHSARYREGKIALEAGLHRLHIKYFEDYMGQSLTVGMGSREIPLAPIPSTMLYIP